MSNRFWLMWNIIFSIYDAAWIFTYLSIGGSMISLLLMIMFFVLQFVYFIKSCSVCFGGELDEIL